MQRLIYSSARKATKDAPSITTVDLDVDGNVTALGTVESCLGDDTFKAKLLDGTILSDGHATKKQAGGALKKRHDGSPAKEQKVVKPENVVEVPEPVTPKPAAVTKSAATKSAAPKPAVRWLVNPEETKPAVTKPAVTRPAAPKPAAAVDEEEHPILGSVIAVLDKDWVLDAVTEELLEIPAIMRREMPALEEEG